MRCIIAIVFSTLIAWLNMLAGFPMRNTALVVPERMGSVPGLVDTVTSELRGDEKDKK